MKYYVQEQIVRTGRVHVFRPGYDTLSKAVIALRSKARIAQYEYRTYDYSTVPETHVEHAHIETDNASYVSVISDGGGHRKFTVVSKRGGVCFPFGALISANPDREFIKGAIVRK